jgi:nicotinate-nucleotide pyrophosphorylase (carboxylating)
MKKLDPVINLAIEEDIGFGDITTNALIPEDKIAIAQIIAKEEGIIAGTKIANEIFQSSGLKVEIFKKDGSKIAISDKIMEIQGSARNILSLERTALNILMRMSGIATLTNKLQIEVKSVSENTKIAGTRKTAPGFSKFDKIAILIGGGDPHRFALDDMVLIKDNHIAVVGEIAKSIKLARKNVGFSKKIEIEVENTNDAIIAIESGADIVMLDNMSPKDVNETIAILNNKDLRKKAIIEVSGGINQDNIRDYAKTGVDIISLGFLTHSVKSLDLSLNIKIE